MTKELEALKLALEALEWCQGGEPCGTAAAIAAIKEALAQPAQETKIGCVQHDCDECKARQAQRPWVGLTDEEMLIATTPNKTRHWVVCAAEAKLKEKNA
jgi:hypothetical protein